MEDEIENNADIVEINPDSEEIPSDNQIGHRQNAGNGKCYLYIFMAIRNKTHNLILAMSWQFNLLRTGKEQQYTSIQYSWWKCRPFTHITLIITLTHLCVTMATSKTTDVLVCGR